MTPTAPAIALVDYGAGNLRSVARALQASGGCVTIARDAAALAAAQAIVVPGVGHFSRTRVLDNGWRSAIRARVRSGAVLFGICLGMHWLFDASDEAPALSGFGAFAGTCARLTAGAAHKVPHVGWNTVQRTRDTRWLAGVPDGAAFYFTHSYTAPVTSDVCAVAEHGQAFGAVVARDRVAGVQFHPEKSGDAGLHVLRNVVEIARESAC